MDATYSSIEAELQKRRGQMESVKGSDVPVRVEFRYRGGTKHWQYFTDLASAEKAEDSSCRYLGSHGVIERPLSKQVQFRGPRGGWRARNPAQTEGRQ